jgi:hypothetical protein
MNRLSLANPPPHLQNRTIFFPRDWIKEVETLMSRDPHNSYMLYGCWNVGFEGVFFYGVLIYRGLDDFETVKQEVAVELYNLFQITQQPFDPWQKYLGQTSPAGVVCWIIGCQPGQINGYTENLGRLIRYWTR